MRWSTLAIGVLAAACTRGGDASLDSARDSAATGASTAARPADSGASPTGTTTGVATPAATPSQSPPAVTPRPPATTPPSTASVMDSLRGVAAVVGSERTTSVSLRVPGRRAVQLTGPQAALVGRVSGTDVSVRGHFTGTNTFEVASFVVRAVDGTPVRDGVLGRDGERYHLVLADGSRQVVLEPPARLREHVGDRVWVSGTAENPVVTFGVIEDRR
jgi:hypothetical protein